MKTPSISGHTPPTRAQLRNVRLASGIGSTIEWYLSFAYISAAGLIFSQQFFGALGPNALIVSLGSVAASFIASPLGGVIAGHFGDRYGRKATLIGTLCVMGIASLGMGVLPTYEQIGMTAPVLLVILRFIQGLSTGGEWGGAALMAVEYAPEKKRGFYGVFSQIGTPAGFVLATGSFFLVQALTTPEQFTTFGWRIPFFISVALVLVGIKIRTSIEETPAFAEVKRANTEARIPLKEAFKGYTVHMTLAAGAFMANILAGLLLIGYFLPYTTSGLGMEAGPVLLILMIASLIWIGSTLWGGVLADRFGARKAMMGGYILLAIWAVPMFLLIDSRSLAAFALAVFVLAIGLGVSYGPQSSLFAALFPPRIRYTAASLPYAVGGILGGGFAPAIAEGLHQATGTSMAISAYIIVFMAASIACLVAIKPRHLQGFATPHETVAPAQPANVE
ncbi:MFS transporter [Paenarthrobacter nitroguajacolicus]|uniref:MFS transporter n=1 Tax=Paenarthrobacter nitroguajacolicus TaxID=211146 RepID=UPI0028663E29|nr:MFS transporter [Paenarthrobacter nitroguajacolicus]MDR6639520.1 MFS family permease [Paenarthrobacter nitroguajacolicus]